MRKIMTFALASCVMLSAIVLPASAASLGSDTEYYESSGSVGVFNTSTTTDEPVSMVGVTTTEDRADKNAAVEPPPYGIYGGYIATDYVSPYYDNYNTGGSDKAESSSGSAVWQMLEDSAYALPSISYQTAIKYFDNGTIGSLNIPALGIIASVYEGSGADSMRYGLGHIEGTSAWDGNICLSGHNRGANVNIGGIKDLVTGDTITYTTPYGTRSYEVLSVQKVVYTDTTCLAQVYNRNMLTLITCVAGQSNYRWVLTAVEVG